MLAQKASTKALHHLSYILVALLTARVAQLFAQM